MSKILLTALCSVFSMSVVAENLNYNESNLDFEIILDGTIETKTEYIFEYSLSKDIYLSQEMEFNREIEYKILDEVTNDFCFSQNNKDSNKKMTASVFFKSGEAYMVIDGMSCM